MVLVTGAAGYLGSHALAALLEAGCSVIGVDDYRTSNPGVVDALERLCGVRPSIVEVDLTDPDATAAVFDAHPIDQVIHFAGLKSVGESMTDPLAYYGNNIGATTSLLAAMEDHDVRDIVFSSSCTVYGDAERVPIGEDQPINPVSPYGDSKAVIERMLRAMVAADPRWRVLSLRYFNPIGAHASGLIGEDPTVAPTTLMPHVMRALIDGAPLQIFGDDYPTRDGTCIRDYIHVSDLIDGHLAALRRLPDVEGFEALNLGTGRGVSVLEIVQACSDAAGRPVPHRITERRAGDAGVVFADPTRAEELLQWRADRSLAEACADHLRWQTANPAGYRPQPIPVSPG